MIAEYQLRNWKKYLRSRKFRKVSEFINSNTTNKVLVYHKKVGQPPQKKKKATPVADPFTNQGE